MSSLNSWDDVLPQLRERYPGATDGILFCVHKLRRDPSLTTKEFRDEALEHGVKVAGRALFVARQLLGIDDGAAASRTPKPAARAGSGSTRRGPGAEDLETGLIRVMQQIQEQATEESRRLREAMRQALDVARNALRGEPPR